MGWSKNFGKPEGTLGRLLLSDMNIGHTPISKWGLTHYDWQPDTAALDIGCGGGANVKRMLKLSPQGTVCGIDISDESVIKSKKVNLSELGRRCTIARGSAERIPFPDGKFDVATAFETVYFWPDLSAAFVEVLRVLKPGGAFLIICEESNPDSVWQKLVEGMTVHSPAQLEALLESAGFAQIETDCPSKSRLCIKGRKPA